MYTTRLIWDTQLARSLIDFETVLHLLTYAPLEDHVPSSSLRVDSHSHSYLPKRNNILGYLVTSLSGLVAGG